MKKKQILLIFLGAIMIFSSCKKGDTGPQGPKGDTGNTGAAGSQGPQGTPGTPAQVIYSTWDTVHFVSYTHDPNVTETAEEANFDVKQVINVPKLTSNILDSGTILMYIKTIEGNTYSIDNYYGIFDKDNVGAFNYSPSHSYTIGKIELFVYPANIISRINGKEKYRYILVPGLTSAGRMLSGPAAGFSQTELRKMSYSEVAKLFNIK